MDQATINARMEPWGDAQIRRFTYRLGLFQRRGWPEALAEAFADRLALRDQDKDDRRACIECKHLQRDGGCFAAVQGWLKGVSARHHPVADVLFRCDSFEFQTP